MPLPQTGDENWGDPLNSYITGTVLATADQAQSQITTHQSDADPHGDRAYAQALVNPLTSNINKANGLVRLDANARIPTSAVPTGGGRTSTYDVVADYQAPTDGVTNASPAIQEALNDCANAGGGEVWIGTGRYALGETLYIGPNTWLHLSPAAQMLRIAGSNGTAPAYMAATYSGSSPTTSSYNVMIQGGAWAFSSMTTAGTPFVIAGGSFIEIVQVQIQMLPGSPAILLAGCNNVEVRDTEFTCAAPGTTTRATCQGYPPAIRIETLTSSLIPGLTPSMYTNAPCGTVAISDCDLAASVSSDASGNYCAVNGLAGTTAPVSAKYHTGIAVYASYASAPPGAGLTAANWQQATVFGNLLNAAQTMAVSWTPSTAPTGAAQVVLGNTPPDAWHSIALNTGYAVPSGGFAKYRLTQDNTVRLSFSISTSNTTNIVGFTQVTKTALPAAYRPLNNHYFSVGTNKLALWGAGSNPDNESTQAVGQMSANGFIYIFGVAADANVIYWDVEIPLDV